jgi:RNA 2',3'-cyclic 3'-phosphodiesterase
MRVFIAIELPQVIKDYLEDTILNVEKDNTRTRIKWVEANNLHLTLAFIENIGPNKLTALQKQLTKVKIPENLILTLGQLGGFPETANPRVIKVGLNDNEEKIDILYSQIQKILHKLDLPKDSRPYNAHITLGRIKDHNARLRLQQPIEKQYFTVKHFNLIKSQLLATGPIYTNLQTYA